MRFQIALLLLFISLPGHAVDDKSMDELFKKYDLVMDEKKVELVDEIFSKKFLHENGGKKEFSDKVKELPKTDKKKEPKTKLTWKKGVKGQMFFAKLEPVEKTKEAHAAEFIVVKEDGKLKIDGTLSDGD